MKCLIILLIFLFFSNCNYKEESCQQIIFETKTAFLGAASFADSLKIIYDLNNREKKIKKCSELYLFKANIYFMLDKLELSKIEYLKASILDTSDSFSLYKLGVLCYMQEHYDSSILYLEKALQRKTINGNGIIDLNSLGSVESKQQVLHTEIIFQQALTYYYWKKYKMALIGFNYCIENNIELADSHLYRGTLNIMLSKFQSACDDFSSSTQYGNDEAMKYSKKYCIP